MHKYLSHYTVEAAPIIAYLVVGGDKVGGQAGMSYVETESHERINVPPYFFARGEPAMRDYIVRYDDGYLSWLSRSEFENRYAPLYPA